MGQKVNPIGFRLAVRRDWKSRWYAKGQSFARMVIKDAQARRFIEREYVAGLVSRIEIERTIKNVRLIIHAARPGVIIGKKGEDIDRLRAKLRNIFELQDVMVDIKEINQPETDARLIALNIASQLENRVMFRRAMRRALMNAMRMKVDGIKIMVSGRLNGIEIARTERYHEGRVPLHTLKNDIDYGFAEARTAMGAIGIKVWISKGDTYGRHKQAKYTLDAPPAASAKVEIISGEEVVEEAATATVSAAADDLPETAADMDTAETDGAAQELEETEDKETDE